MSSESASHRDTWFETVGTIVFKFGLGAAVGFFCFLYFLQDVSLFGEFARFAPAIFVIGGGLLGLIALPAALWLFGRLLR